MTLRLVPFLLFFLLASAGFAQTKSVLLEEYIAALEKEHGVHFSYESGILRSVPAIVPDKRKSLKAKLGYLDEHTAFSFHMVNKRNVTITPRYPGKNFILSGTVYDLTTREPVFGVVVTGKGYRHLASTGEDGRFFSTISYSDADSVIVSCSGYKRRKLPMAYFTTGTASVYLESEVVELAEVLVNAYLTQGVTYDALDNSISLRPKNQNALPGQNNGDILHSLEALPGISTPDSKAGSLNIRGSSPDQTLISFDDIPIYLKGHFFGTISPFNAALIDRIDVQRSTMNADKGGRVGGSIEITSPSIVTNKMHGTVSSSLLDAALYLQVPVVHDKLSFSVSGRRSYPYSISTPTYDAITNFIFQETMVGSLLANTSKGQSIDRVGYTYNEINARMSAVLSAKHKLSASFLHLDNLMVLDSRSDQQQYVQADRIRLDNLGFSSSLHSDWTRRFSTTLLVTGSVYSQECTTDRTMTGQDSLLKRSYFANNLTDLRLQTEARLLLSSVLSLKTGYNLHFNDVDYSYDGRDTSASYTQDFHTGGTLHSVYSSLIGTFRRVSFNAGLRANYFSLTGKVNAEPRFHLSYKLSRRLRLKASGGYQQQFLTQISGAAIESIGGVENPLWLLADGDRIPVVKGYQLSLGGMWQKDSWLIDIETYVRQVDRISSISIRAPYGASPYITGELQTLGADLLVRRQWKHFDAWVSYTLSKSEMRFDSINDGEAFASLFDQRHILDLAGSYTLGRWKFSLAWKLRTGLAALPTIRGKMLHGAGTSEPQGPQPPPGSGPPPLAPGSDPFYDDRFPVSHQLDASVQYTLTRSERKWQATVGASVMNLYNRQNIMEQILKPTPQGMMVRNKYMLGFTPNLFMSISF